MSAQPYVLLEPRQEHRPEATEPAQTIRPTFSGTETQTATRVRRKTVRTILFSAVSSVARYADKYAYYSRLGYSRDAARRKARWHIR